MARNLDYKADLLADLRDDIGFAGEYLSAAYADSKEAFLVALRDVAEAQKGVAKVAKQARVNREHLYRTLSKQGNPTLSTIGSVLDVLGLKVLIVPQQVIPVAKGNPSSGEIVSKGVAAIQENQKTLGVGFSAANIWDFDFASMGASPMPVNAEPFYDGNDSITQLLAQRVAAEAGADARENYVNING